MRNLFVSTTLLLLLGMSGCGGGSSGSDSQSPPPPPPQNQAPSANAGADKEVDEGSTVSLAGSGSDSDGTIQQYLWTQTSGIEVSIANSDTANASFTAPAVSASEQLNFSLTVTDDDGAMGSDSVAVTVNDIPPPLNEPPVVDAGPDHVVFEGNDVSLNGSANDADGTVVSYLWEQVSGTAVTIQDANTPSASFTAPNVSADQILQFRLTATDDDGATASDSVVVTVFDVAGSPPPNEPPVVDAGLDQVVDEGSDVSLNGSATDADGTVVSYLWEQLSGTVVTIQGSTTANASFIAPDVSEDQVLQFRLTATDNDGATAGDTVSVTVNDVPPTQTTNVIALEFSGTISSVSILKEDPFQGAITVGMPFTGTVTYDGEALPAFPIQPDSDQSEYYADGLPYGFSISLGGLSGTSVKPGARLTYKVIAAQPPRDAIDIQTTDFEMNGAFAYLTQIFLGDSTETAVTTLDLPQSAPILEGFDTRDLFLGFGASSDPSAIFVGTIQQIETVTNPTPVSATLSGSIGIPSGTATDTDVNDTNAPYTSNDSPETAQFVPNPVTSGGYVNVPNAGEVGRSLTLGDVSDFYRVNLVAGQSISLFVAESTLGDADLYLWDSSGTNILDASLGSGGVESLLSPLSGELLVEVYAISGATNYVLSIGNSAASAVSSGSRLSDDFVPGEMIIRTKSTSAGASQTLPSKLTSYPMGLRRKAGAPDRPMLYELDQSPIAASTVMKTGSSVGVQARERKLARSDLVSKYRTLIALKDLQLNPTVQYAHPNFRARAFAEPNDEAYPFQWHYPLINLPAAWDITVGDPSITVAVVDTGVLFGHPDLLGQFVPGYDFISNPANSLDGDGIDPNPEDPGDGGAIGGSTFHGTHVSGTISARTNNTIGVAGVAGAAKVMPIRVLGKYGLGTTYDISQGIRYAAGLSNDSGTTSNPPVDVINLSLGGQAQCPPDWQELFLNIRQAGVAVVAAAGNETVDVANASPANCDNVIAVSAVGMDRQIAPYSNFGEKIDIAAPGGDTSTDLNADGYLDGVLSTGGDDSSNLLSYRYPFKEGTSMAAPHVSGVLALMKSVNPGLTPTQIDQVLLSGALSDDIGSPFLYGNGLINARKAVVAALEAIGSPPIDSPLLDVTPQTLNFESTGTTNFFTARNSGGGLLQVTGVFWNEPWLNVTAENLTVDNLGEFRVTVDRNGISEGTYSDSILIQSTANSVQLPILMQVANTPAIADVGYIYVLLVDAASGQTVKTLGGSAVGSQNDFQFTNVPAGAYVIVAGTDFDNDFTICDSGEACGGYPTLAQLNVIQVDADKANLSFSVGHEVSIGAQATEVRSVSKKLYQRNH